MFEIDDKELDRVFRDIDKDNARRAVKSKKSVKEIFYYTIGKDHKIYAFMIEIPKKFTKKNKMHNLVFTRFSRNIIM